MLTVQGHGKEVEVMNVFKVLLQECGWVKRKHKTHGVVWAIPIAGFPKSKQPWFADSFVKEVNVGNSDHVARLVVGLRDLLDMEPKSADQVKPLMERLGIAAAPTKK